MLGRGHFSSLAKITAMNKLWHLDRVDLLVTFCISYTCLEVVRLWVIACDLIGLDFGTLSKNKTIQDSSLQGGSSG